MRPLNARVLALLQSADLDAVAALAASRRSVLSALTALSYHSDPSVQERAIEAFGLSAASLAARDPEAVRIHLRRLFWLLTDESGGIGWRAPELIGAALANCPGQFDEFLSPLVHLLDLEPEDLPRFRPSILIALARLSVLYPQVALLAQPFINPDGS